jgi:hypothetical protein
LKLKLKKTDTPTFAVTVSYDSAGGDAAAAEFTKLAKSPAVAGQALRISTYKNYFSRQNRNASADNQLADPPKYLAILEFADRVDLEDVSVGEASVVAGFKLLGAFGDKVAYFK